VAVLDRGGGRERKQTCGAGEKKSMGTLSLKFGVWVAHQKKSRGATGGKKSRRRQAKQINSFQSVWRPAGALEMWRKAVEIRLNRTEADGHTEWNKIFFWEGTTSVRKFRGQEGRGGKFVASCKRVAP